MPRKKVNLQWITNDATRQSTFERRSVSLMKKANDLATLCGVKVSLVAYKDDDDAMPQVYPSDLEARQLLTSFKAVPDELENLKKVLNMEEYLRCRISKMQEQKDRSDHEKHEDEISCLLHDIMAGHGPSLPSLTTEELLNLKCIVENRMKNVAEHFQEIAVQGSFKEPQVLPQQEQSILCSQLQAHNTYTNMEIMSPIEEHQPQGQGWLVDLASSGGYELGPMVYNNVGTIDGGANPITSGGDIIMQDYNKDNDF